MKFISLYQITLLSNGGKRLAGREGKRPDRMCLDNCKNKIWRNHKQLPERLCFMPILKTSFALARRGREAGLMNCMQWKVAWTQRSRRYLQKRNLLQINNNNSNTLMIYVLWSTARGYLQSANEYKTTNEHKERNRETSKMELNVI
jgi:hypothetical protein